MKSCALAILLAAGLLAQGQGQVRTGGFGGGRFGRGGPPAEAPAAPTDPAERASLEGQVRNAATGEPLRKANLVLRRATPGQAGGPPMTYGASSDASGNFAFRDIEPGEYRLTANRNGFAQTEYGARAPQRPGTPLTLASKQRMREIVLRLTPHAVIAGRILDEDGEPVARVQVQPMRARYLQGRMQLMPAAGGASTNDLGEYRIFGLAPGRYNLSASLMDRMFGGQPDIAEDSAEGYVPTFYPGTHTASSAVVLELAPGQQLRGVDFTLSKARTVPVKGRVANLSGGSTQGMNVMLQPRGQASGPWNMQRARVREPQGNFELRGVAPGSYTLVAMATGNGRPAATGRLSVEVGNEPIDNLLVNIQPPFEVRGQVRVEGVDAPILSGLQFQLRPREGAGMMFGPGANARIEPDLTFTLPSVSPDSYDLNLTGLPDGYYLKTIRSAGQEFPLEGGLDLTTAPSAPLEILLSPKAAAVDGVAFNTKDQPLPGATVVLVPEAKQRGQQRLYRTAISDQTGLFKIKNVPPGDYKLFAWEDLEPGAYMDPDVLKPIESSGQTVKLDESATATVKVKALPAQ
jgi:Carboxypeptidase regulatory-like domain